MLGDEHRIREKIKDLITDQLSLAERSRLINQMLETNKSFTYEEVIACIRSFLTGLALYHSESIPSSP